jgi:hypothetical protein
MFAMTLLGPKQQSAICQSRSGYYISAALDKATVMLPQEVHSTIGGYLARLDSQLEQGRQGQPIDPNQPNNADLFKVPDLSNLSNGLEQFIPNLNEMLPQQGSADPATLQPSGGLPAGFAGPSGFPGLGSGNGNGGSVPDGQQAPNGLRSTGGNSAERPGSFFPR